MPSADLQDLSILFLPRLLAEAVRSQLDASPSDLAENLPCGTLTVERAWLPVYKLESCGAIVVTVLAGDDSGQRISRGLNQDVQIAVDFSVQQLIEGDPQSEQGKAQIDAAADFAQRCLQAAFAPITDADGRRYAPQSYERTLLDETLLNWNQFSALTTIQYKVIT